MTLCPACSLPKDKHVASGNDPLGCVPAQAEAIVRLLDLIGDRGVCRGCGQVCVWVKHKNGSATPYDLSGLNHFVSCPQRDRFKKGPHA